MVIIIIIIVRSNDGSGGDNDVFDVDDDGGMNLNIITLFQTNVTERFGVFFTNRAQYRPQTKNLC